MKKTIESGIPTQLEAMFISVSVILYSDGVLSIFQRVVLNNNEADFGGEEGNIVQQLCFILIFLIASFLFKKRNNSFVNIIVENKMIISILLLCFLSSIWSVNPAVTLRRAFGLSLTTFFSFYLITSFNLKKVLQLINKGLITCTFLSLFFVLFLPQMGLHTSGEHEGAWRGIYVHKNILGAISTLQAISSLCMYYFTSKRKYLFYWFFGLILIVFARSTSSLIITLMLSAVSHLVILVNRSKLEIKAFYLILFLLLILTSLVVYVNIESIFELFGKDMTFTGRTLLWYNLFEYIQKEPYLGYGYGAFWLGEFSLSGKLWNELGWEMPHAHNGYINVTLELGISGLILLIMLLIKKMRLLIRELFISKNSYFLWPFLILSFFIIGNFSETYVLKQNSIYWVLFVYSVLYSVKNKNSNVSSI